MAMRSVILLLALGASLAAAQTPAALGTRVRTIPGRGVESRRVGTVLSVSGDSAVVQLDPRTALEPRADILNIELSRLEVPAGTRRHRAVGALVGGTALGFAGFYVGSHALGDLCEGSPTAGWQCTKDQSGALPLLGIGSLAGALVGAWVGHFVRTDAWKPFAPGR